MVAEAKVVDVMITTINDGITFDYFRQDITTLIQRWSDPEFWKDTGCLMDSADCAKELAELLHPNTDGTGGSAATVWP